MEKTHGLFIINPRAGAHRGRHVERWIMANLPSDRFSYDVTYTRFSGHATELAREASADFVVAVGGDGTVNEVAQGLLGTRKLLGIIPCGSGNGLAHHLGIPLNKAAAVRIIQAMHVLSMDYGLIQRIPFFCTCGVGLDATVSQRFADLSRRGLQAYVQKAVETWLTYRAQEYTICVDGQVCCEKALLITVGNANQWGNWIYICPRASVCDGLLDVTLVRPFPAVEIPLIAGLLLAGRLDESERIVTLRGRHISIHRAGEDMAHYDGEPVRLGDQIEITVGPDPLRVLAPESADSGTLPVRLLKTMELPVKEIMHRLKR